MQSDTLHRVTILFRAQDHLTRYLGRFANLFTGLQSQTDTYEKTVNRIGQIQSKLAQQQLTHGTLVARNTENLSRLQTKHAKAITALEQAQTKQREAAWNKFNSNRQRDEKIHQRVLNQIQAAGDAERNRLLLANREKISQRVRAFDESIKSESMGVRGSQRDIARLERSMQTVADRANLSADQMQAIRAGRSNAQIKEDLQRAFRDRQAFAKQARSQFIAAQDADTRSGILKDYRKSVGPLDAFIRENLSVLRPGEQTKLLADQRKLAQEELANRQATVTRLTSEREIEAQKQVTAETWLNAQSQAQIEKDRIDATKKFQEIQAKQEEAFLSKQKDLTDLQRSQLAERLHGYNQEESSLRRVAREAEAAGEARIAVNAKMMAQEEEMLPLLARYEAAQQRLGKAIATMGSGMGMIMIGGMLRGVVERDFRDIVSTGLDYQRGREQLAAAINNQVITPQVLRVIQSSIIPTMAEPEAIQSFVGLRQAFGGNISDVLGANWQIRPDTGTLQQVEKFKSVMEGVYKARGPEIDQLLTQIERLTPSVLGGVQLSSGERTKRFNYMMNEFISAEALYGGQGRMPISGVKSFLSRMTTAGMTMSPEGLYETLVLSTMMPGGTVGAGITQLYNAILAPQMVRHSTQTIENLAKMGLIDPKGIIYGVSKKTGKKTATVERVLSSAIMGRDVFEQNPVFWLGKYFAPALEKMTGPIKSGETQEAYARRMLQVSLSSMGSTEALRQVIQILAQNPRIHSEAQAGWHATNVSREYQRLLANPMGVFLRWHVAIKNLQNSLSVALLPALTDWANKLIPLIDRLGDFISKHQKLAEAFFNVTLAITALLPVLGSLMILVGGFQAMGAIGAVAKSGAAVVAAKAAQSLFVPAVIGSGETAVGVAVAAKTFPTLAEAITAAGEAAGSLLGVLGLLSAAMYATNFLGFKDGVNQAIGLIGSVIKLLVDGFEGVMLYIGGAFVRLYYMIKNSPWGKIIFPSDKTETWMIPVAAGIDKFGSNFKAGALKYYKEGFPKTPKQEAEGLRSDIMQQRGLTWGLLHDMQYAKNTYQANDTLTKYIMDERKLGMSDDQIWSNIYQLHGKNYGGMTVGGTEINGKLNITVTVNGTKEAEVQVNDMQRHINHTGTQTIPIRMRTRGAF